MHYELTKYSWRGALFCLSLALVAAGCSMSDDLDCPSEGGLANSGKTYIRLSFAMPGSGSTRANPSGGELGDDQEAGQSNENTISSAVAFLYQADGVNADGETPIAAVVEFNSLSGPAEGTGTNDNHHDIDKVYTNTQEVPEIEYGTYHVIVAANLSENDDTRWWTGANLTLGNVRAHILTKAWTTEANGSYSNFLMTNESDAFIELTEKNTSANPAETTVDVERVAARVDYKALNSYQIDDNGTNISGTVIIKGAYIVNRLDAGSYFLKHVTAGNDVNGNVTYLGDETASSGVATNYVIDPWTKDKTAANASSADAPFTVDGEQVNAAGLYAPDTYFPDGSDDPEDWAEWCQEGDEVTDPDSQSESWRRVGYCMENTTASDATMKQYNTGIVFRAKFAPTGIEDYNEDNTFFTYDGKFYTSLTKMMGEINGRDDFATYVNENIEDKYVDGIHAFAKNLKDDPVGYKAYLLSKADDKVYDWTEYLLNILGVDESNEEKGPQINQIQTAEKKTRAILYEKSSGRIRTYYNGQCYYIWWLRHSNNNDNETNGVMEYAVVRNNIYKLDVKEVTSLGGDIPNVEGLRVKVYVHDWVMLDEEPLPM